MKMPSRTAQSPYATLTVDGHIIEKVDRYVYLGKDVDTSWDLLPDIKRHITLGWAAFSKVANIMKSRKARMKIKREIHNEYVLPVMVYDSEAWPLTKAKWSASCSASPYVTTNVIRGYDIRHV